MQYFCAFFGTLSVSLKTLCPDDLQICNLNFIVKSPMLTFGSKTKITLKQTMCSWNKINKFSAFDDKYIK